jgi:hypothetical protein
MDVINPIFYYVGDAWLVIVAVFLLLARRWISRRVYRWAGARGREVRTSRLELVCVGLAVVAISVGAGSTGARLVPDSAVEIIFGSIVVAAIGMFIAFGGLITALQPASPPSE